ncbi:MAG TPA: nickel-binding protein [Terrimicrobiaceae bacterium]
MPIYMDRHFIEGATHHALANAHQKDLATQGKYGVRFMTYWFDEVRSTAFCLVDAPNKEAIQKAHDEAHGDVPSEIIEVDPMVVEAFLGRVKDPPTMPDGKPIPLEAGLRAIMFTDLQGSTSFTNRLGETKALHLLHVHNALTRKELRAHGGREVKHLGDGIMAAFASINQGLKCAIAIQRAFANYNSSDPNTPLHLRIALSAGEPVEDDNDLFGVTVQLAARLCAHAEPDQILVTDSILENFAGEKSLFASAGQFNPKGFDREIPVFEVQWQGL